MFVTIISTLSSRLLILWLCQKFNIQPEMQWDVETRHTPGITIFETVNPFNHHPPPMASTSGRPELDNTDIVNHAIKTILVPLQDYIFQMMDQQFGGDWWDDKIVSCKFKLNASKDLPDDKDLTMEDARSYLDVTLSLNIIDHYNLLPRSGGRNAVDAAKAVRRVRNFQGHDGRVEISQTEAISMISQVITLDDVMNLGCNEELVRLMGYILIPKSAPAKAEELPEPEHKAPKNDGCRPICHGTAASRLHNPPAIPEIAPSQPGSIVDICIQSCDGMHQRLERMQNDNDSSASRALTEITEIERIDTGRYVLRLEEGFRLDDSLGMVLAGKVFTSETVSFCNYNRMNRTLEIYTEDEDAIKLLDWDELQYMDRLVFTDLKWLISATREFFDRYRYRLNNPWLPSREDIVLGETYLDLSDEQRRAVQMSVSEPLSYVWGVPGSGKTQYVLATAINECVGLGKRVAVIAPTNVALEQVLRGLLKSFLAIPEGRRVIDPRRDVLRVGTPTNEFVSEYGYVCDRKDLQRKLADMVEDSSFARIVRRERGFDRYRDVCNDAIDKSHRIGEKDAQGRRNIIRRLDPLLRLLREDPRGMFADITVSEESLENDCNTLRNRVFGRDRSGYTNSRYWSMSDDELDGSITAMDREVESLRNRTSIATVSTAKVVAMTLSRFILSFGPDSAGGKTPLDVDHVFVDEAAYCNSIQTYTLFSLGVPVTLLGDHKQLEPVCEPPSTDLEDSVRNGDPGQFDFLWNMSALYTEHFLDGDVDALKRMYLEYSDPDFVRTVHSELTTTHRFGQNLAEVLHRYVYTPGLSSATNEPLDVVIIDAPETKFPYNEVKQKDRRENHAEAEAIREYVKGLKGQDYIILSPYKNQTEYLTKTLKLGRVMTIHKSQGREWDTVIISVCDCRANLKHNTLLRYTSIVPVPGEEIKGLRVMNTALSRAKKRLVLVCDAEFWASRQNELVGDIVRNNVRNNSVK